LDFVYNLQPPATCAAAFKDALIRSNRLTLCFAPKRVLERLALEVDPLKRLKLERLASEGGLLKLLGLYDPSNAASMPELQG
jgi:hypothetical protein